MLKCEIDRNIITQRVDIYIFDKEIYIKYEEDGFYSSHKYEPYIVEGLKPFISIPYDIWDIFKDSFKSEFDIEEASTSHLKDLRWILTHFINKDKK